MKNNRLIYLLIGLLALWLTIISFTGPQNNTHNETININEYNVSGFSTDFTKVVEDNKDAIVTVMADGSISTGFVYSQNDDVVYIVTSYHSVASSNNIVVTFGSSYNLNAELVGYSEICDVAVLSINTPYSINNLKMSDSSLLKRGEFVISIGTPSSLDYAGTVQLGMIANEHMVIENSISSSNIGNLTYYLDTVGIVSNLQEGYSGGPVLNMNGEVVGMITMNYDDNLDLAITSNEVRLLADRIIKNEPFDKIQFGVKATFIKDMPSYEKTNLNIDIQVIDGMYVNRVRDNSLCFNAGIRNGDIISKINDVVIHDLNDYLDVCYSQSENYNFEVIRNGETVHFGIGND